MIFHMPESGRLLAPAKINLHLHVTEMLDDGRHALDTSFVYVDVYDVLTLRLSKEITVECNIDALSGHKNLVFQVLFALQKKYQVNQGLHVKIEKNLPHEAGLGGGSSDAASALLAANVLWDLHLTTEALIAFATPFGADIPCFLFGQASLAKGVGEDLSVYPESLPNGYICLAKPKKGLSTRDVFHQFDRSQDFLLTKQKPGDKVRPASRAYTPIGSNDLEGSAATLLPMISSVLSNMRLSSKQAWMSGSGSTCIGLCSSKLEATQLADHLQHEGLVSWTHVGQLLKTHPSFV
ncbi:MAG: 4-(cytidine 5'-diphospho)-2-C-methyl-D-erythritol kinase [Mariprofundaceae bacterium]|nr:4-(cytidine 5'-diphospho)-2-C-methyl-D-erythritol kinase [Mariprofundaceae bacterium]